MTSMTGGRHLEITPEVLLKAYACGIFPMADSADDPDVYWVEPALRGVLPLEAFHVPRRLARTLRADRFTVMVDNDFEGIIDGCAAARPGRRTTWINARIRNLYGELFRRGFVHTVEAWRERRLVGGLYGVALGGAFFGESMFSDERDASKVTLVHLVARLRRGGFRLLDTQFATEHLARFGVTEVPRPKYHWLLEQALAGSGRFYSFPEDCDPAGPRPVPGAAVLEAIAAP